MKSRTAATISCIVTIIIDMYNKRIKEYFYTAIGFLLFMIMCIAEIATILFIQQDHNFVCMITGLISFLIMVVIQQIFDLINTKAMLKQTVYKKTIENQQLLIHIVQTLAETIDAKDTYTKGHSGRVANYSKEIARRYGYRITLLSVLIF